MRRYTDLSGIEEDMRRLRADYPDDVAEYEADRWIRVMCDHAADGVWAKSGGATMPEYLPISAELVARIREWQSHYETMPDINENVPGPALEAFGREGLEIAIEMKRQVPHWTVVYYDERRIYPRPTQAQLHEIGKTLHEVSLVERAGAAFAAYVDAYRPWFQYEITPEVAQTGLPPDNYPKNPFARSRT